MSVEINPSSQLGFHRPLTQLVKRTLTITNPNGHPVAFKVKTTAPKSYCVRPNSGRIETGEKVEVQVLLQPMKEDPEPGAKCRDKFLVQSVGITPERESRSLPELWSSVEKEDKSSISEHKIRCTYLPPIEGGAEEANTTPKPNGIPSKAAEAAGAGAAGLGAAGAASALSRDSADHDERPFDTVRSQPPADSSPVHSAHEEPEELTSSKALEPGLAGAGVGAAAVAASGAKPSDDSSSLRAQLADAQKEIVRLRTQLKENEAGLGSKPVPRQAHAIEVAKGEAGLPLQTVLILVGATFVVTWLFF